MNKNPAVLVMTDAKKAFFSLNHNLLLGMVTSFGATEQVTINIKHYLKNRTQFDQIESERTSKWCPEAGIFAGAVLSGMFFNIGRAPQIIRKPYMSNFADDNGAVIKETPANVTWEQATVSELMDQLKWYGQGRE